MRDYGKVHTSFWTSETTRGLSEDGRALALYLLTSPHSTIAGVFRLPDGYVCEDMQWTPERVSKGFRNLEEQGFANRCETSKWVWIRKFIEWNPPENPNQRKGAIKAAMLAPKDCCWFPDFMRDCGELLGIKQEEKVNPSETLSKPFLNQEPEQEPEQEQEPEDKTVAGKPARHSRHADKPYAPPEGVSLPVWQDFQRLRKTKKAPITETAIAGIVREAEKAGWSLEAALQECCSRGWQSFKADWVMKDQDRAGPVAGRIESFAERDALAAKQRWERMTGQQHPDLAGGLPDHLNIIDAEPVRRIAS